jgi:hypothetical protein
MDTSPTFAAFASNPRSKSFEIGMLPLDPNNWIEIDDRLPDYQREKARLIAKDRDAVWRARPDTLDAQAEIRDRIIGFLERSQPNVLAAVDDANAPEREVAPLLWISRLIQDDLVMMRKIGGAWVLAAGSVCFPSSWALADKFDHSMEAIHDPVPGFAGRMAMMVNRIFDHLKPDQPVVRHNLSLYPDGDLDHRTGTERQRHTKWANGTLAETFLRVERQTLMRMSQSGDILFTIKVLTDPIGVMRSDPNGRAVAVRLIDDLKASSQPQRHYKAIDGVWRGLIAEIERQVLEPSA